MFVRWNLWSVLSLSDWPSVFFFSLPLKLHFENLGMFPHPPNSTADLLIHVGKRAFTVINSLETGDGIGFSLISLDCGAGSPPNQPVVTTAQMP
jgi:hypothetical protein